MQESDNHKIRALSRGKIISVRGSVVDTFFENTLPPVFTVLYAGENNQIEIEVISQLDAQRVRGIALNPTQGLARGMAVVYWRQRIISSRWKKNYGRNV